MRTLATRFRGLLRGGAPFDQALPLDRIPFVVLDTELTGLDLKRDSIISIGAVRMTGTRIEMGQSFYRLVSPASRLKRESILVHQITPGEVSVVPPLAAVIGKFLAYCAERVLVGHFLTLDLEVFGREANAFGGADARRRQLDTNSVEAWIQEQARPSAPTRAYRSPERTLNALAGRRGIPIAGAHNALRDAFIAAQLLQRQLRELPALGVRTLGDLLRVGKP